MDELASFLQSSWLWIVWTFSVLVYAATLVAVFSVLQRRDEPMAMLAWVLGLLLLPVIGLALYVLLGAPRVDRRRRRRRALQPPDGARTSPECHVSSADAPVDPDVDPDLRELAHLSSRFGEYPPTSGNRVSVYEDASKIYNEILSAIESAGDHVHLEYYIFRAAPTGRLFRDALTRKAASGVEVRVLIDGIGSWGSGSRFFRPLVDAGGRVEVFLPAVPLKRKWNINYRNHRKIAVIDGRIAFLGSQNIGDEYRGLWRRVGLWKDTHLRIEGPACADVQSVFLADWRFASEEPLAVERYERCLEAPGHSLVQIVPSGPDSRRHLLREYLFLAISLARKHIRILTPYFVPTPGMLLALKTAARRGIAVDVLVPAKTDSRFVLWAGRSYYDELLRAGVRIHEHTTAMLHSKVVLIDDIWALVGSANMDVRSFSTNFELTATLMDSEICVRLATTFDQDCVDANTLSEWPPESQSSWESALEGFARLFSPLL